jgi:hypothetical protein
MERQPVQSSNIKSVGYDAASKVLEIAFSSGGIYQYANVPASEHAALVAAPSVGKYFHAHIKSQYSGRKAPSA